MYFQKVQGIEEREGSFLYSSIHRLQESQVAEGIESERVVND